MMNWFVRITILSTLMHCSTLMVLPVRSNLSRVALCSIRRSSIGGSLSQRAVPRLLSTARVGNGNQALPCDQVGIDRVGPAMLALERARAQLSLAQVGISQASRYFADEKHVGGVNCSGELAEVVQHCREKVDLLVHQLEVEIKPQERSSGQEC